jgi:hypothetical protein
MALPEITYTFFDFEVERAEEVHLVKILAVDGRRFTYAVQGDLTEDAVAYIKTLLDAAVFSDVIIERSPDGFDVRESTSRLKKHS